MSIHFKFKAPDIQKRSQEVDCYRNLNLLAHAQLEELEIGSLCGGHGHCGGDRIRVAADPDALSPITDTERKHLTQAELENGWRLGCQCFPSSDALSIQIEVP